MVQNHAFLCVAGGLFSTAVSLQAAPRRGRPIRSLRVVSQAFADLSYCLGLSFFGNGFVHRTVHLPKLMFIGLFGRKKYSGSEERVNMWAYKAPRMNVVRWPMISTLHCDSLRSWIRSNTRLILGRGEAYQQKITIIQMINTKVGRYINPREGWLDQNNKSDWAVGCWLTAIADWCVTI